MKTILKNVLRINHRHLLPDIVILGLSMYLALYLRLGGYDHTMFTILVRLTPLFLFLKLGTLAATGTYSILWRYLSVKDAVRVSRGTVIMTMVLISVTFLLNLDRIPRSVYLIDGFISLIGILGIRGFRRYIFDMTRERQTPIDGKRILIYGAGRTGTNLLKQYGANARFQANVIGFIDDEPGKLGRLISNVRVVGDRSTIQDVIRQYVVHEIVLAFNPIPGELLKEVLEICRPHKIQLRVFTETSKSRGDVRALDLTRKIELTDLLNRPAREIDQSKISALLNGKRVLVTGAGGSIGSELCRQILNYRPKELLLLDNSEFNLYQIDTELRSPTDDIGPIVPLLVNVCQYQALEKVFEAHSPEVVFHAAAYKHVHLVEKNPLPAIVNNVEGTLNLVLLSIRHSVENFILISTDKAVNPVGVMGSTKRLCEILVSAAGRGTKMRFCSVRFGNVLGSSGSFVPLLQKQIADGQPITITHPDMRRFLMLIPEAVGLVLSATTLAAAGDILILKMGEPIKILDLVKNLLALCGVTEDENPIVFTGVRPGEKLYEELYLSGNEINTDNPDVVIVPKGDAISPHADFDSVSRSVRELIGLATTGDMSAVDRLRELIRVTTPADSAPQTAGSVKTGHSVH